MFGKEKRRQRDLFESERNFRLLVEGVADYALYMLDPAGTITWAAWIEAAHRDDAQAQADALCEGRPHKLDLWSATDRRLSASHQLDPV